MAVAPKPRSPWLPAAWLMLTLGGMVTGLPHAQAQSPKVVTAGITSSAAPVDDGDGDELLEHWGDAKFGREQRVQLAGLLTFLAGCGALSYRRRAALRRDYRHE